MEATRTELQKHASKVNEILRKTCEISHPAPLIQEAEGIVSLSPSCPKSLSREVTSDLGVRETALRLPIPDADNPRFWAALGELWDFRGRHKVVFRQCGLRLYAGFADEEPVQFLRLEWVSPTRDGDGIETYQGKHAGHPHWHIDRRALVGEEDYLRSLDICTAPQTGVQAFSEELAATEVMPSIVLDFSWIKDIHLPARAQWMNREWDGQEVPGPHQCEPKSPDELAFWWAGALRYVSAELPR